jgi:hypothetical protein
MQRAATKGGGADGGGSASPARAPAAAVAAPARAVLSPWTLALSPPAAERAFWRASAAAYAAADASALLVGTANL